MLNRDEFMQEVIEALKERLGEGYSFEAREVTKNNDSVYHGIVISKEGLNISPTVYLDGYYGDYLDGRRSMEDVKEAVGKAVEKGMPKEKIDMDFFRDYDAVKDQLCVRLVNAGMNEGFLKDVPHRTFLDLAAVCYLPVQNEAFGQGTIQINNTHVGMWGVSGEEVMQAARKNTQRLQPAECLSMEKFMCSLMGGSKEDAPCGDMPGRGDIEENPMSIVSNRSRSFGAAVMLYEGYLDRLSEAYGGDVYLLPSSIHELIVMPVTGEPGEADRLSGIVHEVNAGELSPNEILSENVYRYNAQEHSLGIAAGPWTGQANVQGQAMAISM